MGVSPDILSRRAEWCIRVVAGVIGQYALNIGLWQMFLSCGGEKEKLPLRDAPSCFFTMAYVDSITKTSSYSPTLLLLTISLRIPDLF